MRKVLGSIAAAVVLLTPFTPADAAGQAPCPRGARNYDPSTVATVSGKVVAVRTFPGRRGHGVHLDVKTSDGVVLAVHLGPSSFLAAQHLEVVQGDSLEVTGSRVELGGNPTLIARTVRKGDATITLRDASGVPAWAGRRRGW